MVKRGLRKYRLLCGNYCDWDLILLWITIGYQFNRQATLASYSPYQLFCGRKLILLSFVWEKLNHVVDLDDPYVWAQCLHNQVEFFKWVMPMGLEDLYITQYYDTLWYARICSRAYWPQLQQSSKEIMSICNARDLPPWMFRHSILCIKDILL